MSKFFEKPDIRAKNLWTTLALCLMCYFGYHVTAGERSWLRLQSLETRLKSAEQNYRVLHSARISLETKVARLRPGSIDTDLLEEQAHIILGYVAPHEHIIIHSK
jgi:cell division protein FtsB